MILYMVMLLMPTLLFGMEDQDNAVSSLTVLQKLAGAIQIPTVSYTAEQPEKHSDFHKNILAFHAYLEKTFPNVHTHLKKEVINDHSLLYTWHVDTPSKPALLMAHMDVVPVDEDPTKSWLKEPFSGAIDEQYIYGRGTIDIKTPLIAMLHVVEELLKDPSYKPKRTFYFAFGHDEEIGGKEGNAHISQYLKSKNIELEMVVDEGGGVLTNAIEGFTQPIAFVGVAEKGFLSAELSVQGQGGHASMPPAQTIPGILAQAICAIEKNPMPSVLSAPTKLMLEYLAPHMPASKRLIMNNLWLTEGIVTKLFAKKETSNAVVRTTIATTIVQSGVKDNVLPSSGRAVLNCRLLPENTQAHVLQFIKDTVNDQRVSVTALSGGWEASPVSDTQSESFKFLTKVIGTIFPTAIVAPNLSVGATDSRYYKDLTKNIFKFAPFLLDKSELELMHGVNEKLSRANVDASISFYKNIITNF